MEIIKLNIRLIKSNIAQIHNCDLFKYKTEVIRKNRKFYYCANGITMKITPLEAKQIIRNPCLYYFSTALKLHILTERRVKRH